MNVFATTSWKNRVGTTLPLVLDNICKQKYTLDKILVYLSLEEFPNKENDLPKNLLDVKESDKRIDFRWSKGNLKSFKRLLAIKDNPDCKLCIYDDDTIHGTDWIGVGFSNLALQPEVNRVGWIALSCESPDLTSIKTYLPRNIIPNYYNTSDGYFLDTSNYKKVDLDLELPVKLGINDDDYYFHMINTIYGIKSMPYHYLGKSKRIETPDDMCNSIYTHKAVLEYWMKHDKHKFNKYFKQKKLAIEGLPMIDRSPLF